MTNALGTWKAEEPTVKEQFIAQVDQVAHEDQNSSMDWREDFLFLEARNLARRPIASQNPQEKSGELHSNRPSPIQENFLTTSIKVSRHKRG